MVLIRCDHKTNRISYIFDEFSTDENMRFQEESGYGLRRNS